MGARGGAEGILGSLSHLPCDLLHDGVWDLSASPAVGSGVVADSSLLLDGQQGSDLLNRSLAGALFFLKKTWETSAQRTSAGV